MALCDSLPLQGPEGIWQFPDDDVRVLIIRDDAPEHYSLLIVDAFDINLHPGDRIGELTPTPDPVKFRLSLFTECRRGKLKTPRVCAATLDDDREALLVEGPKLKFSLSSTGLLTGFWRMIRFHIDNPASALPEGLIRVYPSYDGNGSSRRRPRYL